MQSVCRSGRQAGVHLTSPRHLPRDTRKRGTRDLGPGNSLLWTFICLLGHTTLESGYRALLARIFAHRVQSSGNDHLGGEAEASALLCHIL